MDNTFFKIYDDFLHSTLHPPTSSSHGEQTQRKQKKYKEENLNYPLSHSLSEKKMVNTLMYFLPVFIPYVHVCIPQSTRPRKGFLYVQPPAS